MSQHWFKRKALGVGVAPASWEGWLATQVYVAMVSSLAYGLIDRSPASPQRIALFACAVIALTAVLIVLTVIKGDHVWGGGSRTRS